MKDFEYLPTGEIVFRGITYPGLSLSKKKINFDPTRWFFMWRERIKEIRNLKLDYEQISFLHNDFIHDILLYCGSKQMLKKHQEVNHLTTELKIAFEQAYSSYRDSKTGFWGFISGLFVKNLINKLEIPKLPLKD